MFKIQRIGGKPAKSSSSSHLFIHPIILKPGYRITIGRKSCNVMLSEDRSVSRKHAILHTSQDWQNLKIEDTNSSYGVFVNGTKISPGSNQELYDGDVFEVGKESKFKVTIVYLNFTTSHINLSTRNQIKDLLDPLGLTLSRYVDVNQTSHLIMEQISFTMKLGLAVVYEIPIVTPDFIFSIFSEQPQEEEEDEGEEEESKVSKKKKKKKKKPSSSSFNPFYILPPESDFIPPTTSSSNLRSEEEHTQQQLEVGSQYHNPNNNDDTAHLFNHNLILVNQKTSNSFNEEEELKENEEEETKKKETEDEDTYQNNQERRCRLFLGDLIVLEDSKKLNIGSSKSQQENKEIHQLLRKVGCEICYHSDLIHLKNKREEEKENSGKRRSKRNRKKKNMKDSSSSSPTIDINPSLRKILVGDDEMQESFLQLSSQSPSLSSSSSSFEGKNEETMRWLVAECDCNFIKMGDIFRSVLNLEKPLPSKILLMGEEEEEIEIISPVKIEEEEEEEEDELSEKTILLGEDNSSFTIQQHHHQEIKDEEEEEKDEIVEKEEVDYDQQKLSSKERRFEKSEMEIEIDIGVEDEKENDPTRNNSFQKEDDDKMEEEEEVEISSSKRKKREKKKKEVKVDKHKNDHNNDGWYISIKPNKENEKEDNQMIMRESGLTEERDLIINSSSHPSPNKGHKKKRKRSELLSEMINENDDQNVQRDLRKFKKNFVIGHYEESSTNVIMITTEEDEDDPFSDVNFKNHSEGGNFTKEKKKKKIPIQRFVFV